MLSAIQQKVLAAVDNDEIVSLASDLVRIPSFTTEETPCAEWLATYLGLQGLEVEMQEVEPGRKQTIGRVRGTGGGRSIMLNGHIDIDPLATGWSRDPFSPWIADGKLYGHGIYNMKAGLTAIIMAALALKRSGVPIRGDVVVACVAAELNGGIGTIHAIQHGARTDVAVVAEPYGCRTILTKHTGTMDVVIHTLGRAVHISRKEQGSDAIEKMGRAIHAINRMRFTHTFDPDLPGLPRLNVGSIIGGRGRNHELRGAYTVSDFCTAYVNGARRTQTGRECIRPWCGRARGPARRAGLARGRRPDPRGEPRTRRRQDARLGLDLGATGANADHGLPTGPSPTSTGSTGSSARR